MTSCFRAVSVGCAVPRPSFEGAVHSVFRSAVNLQVPGETVLLTLLSSEESDLPQGIRLDPPGTSAFEGLSVGTRASCMDGILVVGNSLRVDLRTASDWDCDLSFLAVDMTDPAVVTAWDHVWQALQERQARSRSAIIGADWADRAPTYQSVLTQHLDGALRAILGATINYDGAGMTKLGALVGVGTGLTPSGDDLLTGYLAGLWCTIGRSPERRAFLSDLARLVIRYSTQTNDIARTYLCLATRGQVSSKLVDLAAAISRGADAGCVLASANAAMRVGHSSGMETVKGLLLGLAVWDTPDLVFEEPDSGNYNQASAS